MTKELEKRIARLEALNRENFELAQAAGKLAKEALGEIAGLCSDIESRLDDIEQAALPAWNQEGFYDLDGLWHQDKKRPIEDLAGANICLLARMGKSGIQWHIQPYSKYEGFTPSGGWKLHAYNMTLNEATDFVENHNKRLAAIRGV